MKKFYTLCLIMALSLGAYAQTKKIAVYAVESNEINTLAALKITDALVSSHNFSVVERNSKFIDALGRELSYQQSGFVDESEIVKIGKQLGVSLVCVVSALKIFNNKIICLTARIVDVETAEIVFSISTHTTAVNAEYAINDLSNKLLLNINCKSIAKKKMSVYISSSDYYDLGQIISIKLIDMISKSREYVAVERTKEFLHQIYRENEYQRNGAVDDGELASVGKHYGSNYVCVINIMPLNAEYYITLRLLEVEKGNIVYSYTGKLQNIVYGEKVFNEVNSVAENFIKGLNAQTMKKNKEELPIESVTDCQGNVYPVIKIGSKYWMAEDLRVTEYDSKSEKAGIDLINNKIPYSSDYKQYSPYCIKWRYTISSDKYIYLYNWSAAMGYTSMESRTKIGEQKGYRQGICPNGWHIPSCKECELLIECCGGEEIAGRKLKAKYGWKDKCGTDDFGFSILEWGEYLGRTFPGDYWFWTADNGNAMHFGNYNSVSIDYMYRYAGICVRCVKD